MAEALILKGGGGADTSVVTATASDVLKDKIIVDKDGNPLTGTIPNQGAKTASLNCGGSYTIPEGYHNGSGVITANSLSSQTSGTASAASILSGNTAWVNGSQVTGAMPNVMESVTTTLTSSDGRKVIVGRNDHNGTGGFWVTTNSDGNNRVCTQLPSEGYYGSSSIVGVPTSPVLQELANQGWCGWARANEVVSGATFTSGNGVAITGTLSVNSAFSFSAAALSTSSIRISWTNPSSGPWTGVFIQMSTGGNPGTSGGSRVYTGRGNNVSAGAWNYIDIGGLSPGTTYYFTCTSYVDNVGWGSSYNVAATTSGFTIYDNGYNPYLIRAYGAGILQFVTSNCLQLKSGRETNVSGKYPFRTQRKVPISSLDSYSYLYVQYIGQITTSDRLYFAFRYGGDRLYADWVVSYYMTLAESWSMDYQSSLTTLKISIDKVWNARSNFINLYNQYGYPEIWYQHNSYSTDDDGDFIDVKYKDLNIYKIWLE